MFELTLQLSGFREQKQAEAVKARADLMINRDYALDVETTRIDVDMSNRQLDAAEQIGDVVLPLKGVPSAYIRRDSPPPATFSRLKAAKILSADTASSHSPNASKQRSDRHEQRKAGGFIVGRFMSRPSRARAYLRCTSTYPYQRCSQYHAAASATPPTSAQMLGRNGEGDQAAATWLTHSSHHCRAQIVWSLGS